jgi:hypothetical protein
MTGRGLVALITSSPRGCSTGAPIQTRLRRGGPRNQPNENGWTPLKIADGIQRGLNIVSSAPTAAMIRQVMAQ